jgi:hypothetical protein
MRSCRNILHYTLPNIHPFVHTFTYLPGVNHARRQPARWEQLGLGVFLRITSALSAGLELAPFRFPGSPSTYCPTG